MTTYTELAKDPQAFDTVLATEYATLDKARAALASRLSDVCKAAGARRVSTRHGLVWNVSYDAAYAKLRADGDPQGLLVKVAEARFAITEVELTIQAMDEAYTGWTRFFPSVTKSQPHIHRSLNCHTLHATTVMTWAPSLSGKTDEDAVAELDEALCSVCFPGAPVALHNYVSRKSQAAQAERQAEKDARDAIKARKQLTPAEQFKTQGKYGERVTTVAKCLELIRKAVELAVELEYWTQAAQGTRSVPNWEPEHLARRVRNLTDSLSEAREDAAKAEAVLLAREAAHEGYGATAEAIAKTRASKERSARKDWM